jgi:hypothetical protein
MGTSVYFNNQGASREQLLIEDMIIESIKNHGIDIFYLPRDSQSSLDELFGDDPVKSYTSSYPMEMFLETFNDFEGNQEFFSKFGLEVQKSARVAVARRTFEKYVPTTLRNAPKEGDLIWLPAMQKLMEIKFVEQEKNFFQLGRGPSRGGASGSYEQLGKYIPYMYELSIELFKYNGEILNTGILAVDDLPDVHAFGVAYTLQSGGAGSFNEHEIVYQGANLNDAVAKAYVSSWDLPTRTLTLRNIKGEFTANSLIRGTTSQASWIMLSGNTQEDANDPYDDNFRIEQEADNILDWTELNPFGSPDE